MDGFAYRLVPIKNTDNPGFTASINSDILFDNLMNKFRWGNMDNKDIFVDFYTRRTSTILRVRYKFVQLATQLHNEGDKERSLAVLDRIVKIMPKEQFPYDIFTASIAEVYYMNDAMEKGDELISDYFNQVFQELDYMLSLQKRFGDALTTETNRTISVVQELLRITSLYNQDELSGEMETRIQELANRYEL